MEYKSKYKGFLNFRILLNCTLINLKISEKFKISNKY